MAGVSAVSGLVAYTLARFGVRKLHIVRIKCYTAQAESLSCMGIEKCEREDPNFSCQWRCCSLSDHGLSGCTGFGVHILWISE